MALVETPRLAKPNHATRSIVLPGMTIHIRRWACRRGIDPFKRRNLYRRG